MTTEHPRSALGREVPKAIIDDRDLIFLDTETTQLETIPGQSVVWELYAERHNTNGSIELVHVYPDHLDHGVATLPKSFQDDYHKRCVTENKRTPVATMRDILRQVFRIRADGPRPVLVGANPHFDMRHLDHFIDASDPGVHFRFVDVEAAAYGRLGHVPREWEGGLVGLTKAFHLPVTEAHTAHGDVEMVKNLYIELFEKNLTVRELTLPSVESGDDE